MNPKRHSVHCIIPPHMLRALAAHEDAAVREIALRAITTTSILRGRRQILSQITLARHSEGSIGPSTTVTTRSYCPARWFATRAIPP